MIRRNYQVDVFENRRASVTVEWRKPTGAMVTVSFPYEPLSGNPTVMDIIRVAVLILEMGPDYIDAEA